MVMVMMMMMITIATMVGINPVSRWLVCSCEAGICCQYYLKCVSYVTEDTHAFIRVQHVSAVGK
jgi:hypothetical protein